jgi:hypothetical protein
MPASWAWRALCRSEGLALQIRSFARLAQDEEPGLCSGEAGGGRGMGQTLILKRASASPSSARRVMRRQRSVDHLFRGWWQCHRINVVWACGYGAILRDCRVRWAATRHLTVTRHPRASHLIPVHDLASLEVTRATGPGSLLITQSLPIPRQSAVRVSKRH